jgi:OFA family oxalate/formate antiporter-like MFS transporter
LHSATDTVSGPRPPAYRRWVQLAAGVIGMVAVANFQYGWTFFVIPIQNRFGWERDAIQWAFTLFVFTETWLVPLEGYVADRWGPHRMMIYGALLAAGAWTLNAVADSLALFYLAAIIGGAGVGMVYGTCVGSALKWFPDRRGLAAGLMAAGFGAGSALTVVPIRAIIDNPALGYRLAFLWFGLGQGLVVLLVGLVLRFPRPGETPASSGRVGTPGPVVPDATPLQMLRTPLFWLMYFMMTMTALGGMMLMAQVDPISAEVGVKNVPLALGFWVLPALSLATMLERILGGVTRPLFGWISDHIGREPTMLLAFSLEGVALFLLVQFVHDPVLFVVFTGLTFFFWGEVFSLFPATLGDTFGRRYATTNYGLLYTAKGTATLLVSLGSYAIRAHSGSWPVLFRVAAVMCIVSALLAVFVLRPLRRRHMHPPPLATES